MAANLPQDDVIEDHSDPSVHHQGVEGESYEHSWIHGYSHEETQPPGIRGIEDTAGSLSAVVYTSGGVGMTVREVIEDLRKVNKLIDEEQAKHEAEKTKLNAEKAGLEKQLEETKQQLEESNKDAQAKDKQLGDKQLQLSAKEEVLSIKDQQLRDKDAEMGKKDQQLSELQSSYTKLNTKVDELTNRIAKLDVEYQAKESNYKHRIMELEQQKSQLEVDLENLKKESAHQEQVRQLQHRVEICELEKEFEKERLRMKEKQHELELKLKDASASNIGASVNQQDSNEVQIEAPNATFNKQRFLGTGAFGKVYEGKFDGKFCAVKILNEVAMLLMTDLQTSGKHVEQQAEHIKKEGDCLKRIDHEHVVKLYDIRTFKGFPVLIMEKLDCSLTSYLTCNGQEITELVQLSISCDIASALDYLQQNGIIHRDLCSDNILLKISGRQGPVPIVAKVSDFGMSRILKHFDRMSAKLTSIAGHRAAYYPPELQEDPESYDGSIDIFMFGVVMTQIALRIPEIKSQRHRRELINEMRGSFVLKKHIERCVEVEKNKRPSPKDIYSELKKMYENLQIRVQTGLVIDTLKLNIKM